MQMTFTLYGKTWIVLIAFYTHSTCQTRMLVFKGNENLFDGNQSSTQMDAVDFSLAGHIIRTLQLVMKRSKYVWYGKLNEKSIIRAVILNKLAHFE